MDMVSQPPLECIGVFGPRGIPDLEVRLIEPKDSKASRVRFVLIIHSHNHPANTFLGQFGKIPRLMDGITEGGAGLLRLVLWAKGLGQLHENEVPLSAVSTIELQHGLSGCTRTRKEVQDNTVLVIPDLNKVLDEFRGFRWRVEELLSEKGLNCVRPVTTAILRLVQ